MVFEENFMKLLRKTKNYGIIILIVKKLLKKGKIVNEKNRS